MFWGCSHASSRIGFPIEDALPGNIGLQNFGTSNLIVGASQKISVCHDEVGELPRLKRSHLLLFEQEKCVVDGVEANRLLARQGLLGMQLAIVPAGAAGDSRSHP